MLYRYYAFTTVDITPTNVRTKSNVNEWSIQRNQQRNFDTLVQTIGLRSQPTNIHVGQNCMGNPTVYGLGKNLPESVNIWEMLFDIEHKDPFGKECELLLKDLNYVPIINGLAETEPSFPPVFITTGTFKNITIKIYTK
jgi:hypothetical protein